MTNERPDLEAIRARWDWSWSRPPYALPYAEIIKEAGRRNAIALANAPADVAALLAECERLRAVVDAARAVLVALADGTDAPWWATEYHDPTSATGGAWGCECCISPTAVKWALIAHDPDCPAIVLDAALGALDDDGMTDEEFWTEVQRQTDAALDAARAALEEGE